ncbi:MAG TPA: hypothetical protein VFT11_03690, partial [Candidatus Deferrimicrobiaceae bacterium]|nr:hypothetical protein [Candidatus Deferrimicrobiaceae bacterium]
MSAFTPEFPRQAALRSPQEKDGVGRSDEVAEESRPIGGDGPHGMIAPFRRRFPFPDEDDTRPRAGEPPQCAETVPEDAA